MMVARMTVLTALGNAPKACREQLRTVDKSLCLLACQFRAPELCAQNPPYVHQAVHRSPAAIEFPAPSHMKHDDIPSKSCPCRSVEKCPTKKQGADVNLVLRGMLMGPRVTAPRS